MLEMLTAGGASAPLVKGNIVKVDTGTSDVAVLTSTGNLFVIGTMYFSGTGGSVTTWTKTASDVADFCSGYRQVFIRKNDGSFWFMGQNNHFPTTLGTTITSFVDVSSYFTAPLAGKTVKKMEISQTSLAILCTDGTVVLSGSNASGGMGVGNTTAYRTPTLRSDITNVKDIQFDFSTTDTTYYLTNDGQVYGSGLSDYGQLGTATSPVTSFRLIASNVGQTVSSIRAGITGLFYFRRISSNGIGNITALGRHFNGSLGTGSTSNTSYSTPQFVVTVAASDPDPVLMAGTYHARYYLKNNSVFFTGNSGSYIGGGAFNNNHFSFEAMPITTLTWEGYAQTRGGYTTSYVLSNGRLYGSGTSSTLLPGTTGTINTYTLLDTLQVT